jgi:hypothetical protein
VNTAQRVRCTATNEFLTPGPADAGRHEQVELLVGRITTERAVAGEPVPVGPLTRMHVPGERSESDPVEVLVILTDEGTFTVIVLPVDSFTFTDVPDTDVTVPVVPPPLPIPGTRMLGPVAPPAGPNPDGPAPDDEPPNPEPPNLGPKRTFGDEMRTTCAVFAQSAAPMPTPMPVPMRRTTIVRISPESGMTIERRRVGGAAGAVGFVAVSALVSVGSGTPAPTVGHPSAPEGPGAVGSAALPWSSVTTPSSLKAQGPGPCLDAEAVGILAVDHRGAFGRSPVGFVHV